MAKDTLITAAVEILLYDLVCWGTSLTKETTYDSEKAEKAVLDDVSAVGCTTSSFASCCIEWELRTRKKMHPATDIGFLYWIVTEQIIRRC